MITRPLDLSSRATAPGRDWDWLFFVNGGLIALFFVLFGSRFVLAPGLGTDFRIPTVASSRLGAAATTHVISLKAGGLIFTDSGQLSFAQLHDWLKQAAASSAHPVLLVRASSDVSMQDLTRLYNAAEEAGFARVVWAAEAPHQD